MWGRARPSSAADRTEMIFAASMTLPPPKLTIPSAWAPVAASAPASTCAIGACCEMTTVATGVTGMDFVEPSKERVVISTTRFIWSRFTSGPSCTMDPRPQWMMRGFEYAKSPVNVWSY